MSTKIILAADVRTEAAGPGLELALAKSAVEHMSKALLQKATSGALTGNVRVADVDTDGIDYQGSWTLSVASTGTQALPFGIEVGDGYINSTLANEFSDDGLVDDVGQASADALESFLLALHMEGVSLEDDRLKNALRTAVEAIGNNL